MPFQCCTKVASWPLLGFKLAILAIFFEPKIKQKNDFLWILGSKMFRWPKSKICFLCYLRNPYLHRF